MPGGKVFLSSAILPHTSCSTWTTSAPGVAMTQKGERRAEASRLYESARRMPWLLTIGRTLRAELDAVKQPVSERLAAVLKKVGRPTAT
jgi:hypothetical protein